MAPQKKRKIPAPQPKFVTDPPKSKGGRPPVYDLVKEANDLLEWSLREDATNILQFSNPKPYDVTELYEWAGRDYDFNRALCKARQRIAANREKAASAGTLIRSGYERYAAVYDPILHKAEREEKTFEAELKRISNAEDSATILKGLLEIAANKGK